MTRVLKRTVPEAVRDRLRPYYRALRRRTRPRALRERDWSMTLDVPESQKSQFLEAALTGTVGFHAESNYVNVLLCAQPKSASLYLTQLFALCLDFKNHQIGFDQGGGAIYYPRLLAAKFAQTHTISHCHAPPTPIVLKILQALDLRPIVLTRNLLDALVSRRDMLLRDKWAGELLSKAAVQAFLEADPGRQIDIIIELFADQYINFCAGWDEYRADSRIVPIYITYEEMMEDEIGLVSRVGKLLGRPVSDERVKSFSRRIREAGGINFSIGQQGRGRELMTSQQIEVLRQKARLFGCSNVQFLGFEVE